MNRYSRSIIIAIVALSAVIFCGVDSRSLAGPAYERELNEQQKIEGRNDTGCIEVLEVKWRASECKDPTGLSVRARVKCDMPVDVRICIQKVKGQWPCGEFRAKKAGDELPYYECDAKGKYAILTREVGSSKAWPKP